MSTTKEIRTRIQTTLEGIEPSIGVVHPYERWAASWQRFLELLTDPSSGAVHATTIGRESSEGEREAPDQANRFPLYIVRHYLALKDESETELTFDEEVEAIQDALGADVQLGGLADHVEEPQLRVIEPRLFGSVLCHYAEIAIKVHLTIQYEFAP